VFVSKPGSPAASTGFALAHAAAVPFLMLISVSFGIVSPCLNKTLYLLDHEQFKKHKFSHEFLVQTLGCGHNFLGNPLEKAKMNPIHNILSIVVEMNKKKS
jgi:hypothetical protein